MKKVLFTLALLISLACNTQKQEIVYYESGEVKSKANYVDGIQQGEDIWYYEIDGEKQQFTTEQEPWKIEGAKYMDRKTKLIEKGFEPPIHDFSITTLDGYDITDSILQVEEAYLVVAYDISKTNAEASKKLSDLYLACEEKGIAFVALSASSDKLSEEFRHENNIMFPYLFTDETTLKTIIRSNPGLVQIEEGTIKGKWHFNDFPSIEKLTK